MSGQFIVVAGAYLETAYGPFDTVAAASEWATHPSRTFRSFGIRPLFGGVLLDDDDDDEPRHVGHFSRLGGTWWCDTCNSPYCELA